MNEEPVPRWWAAPDGLHLATALTISFQRYLVTGAPPLPAIPKSLGALEPAELEPGHFLVPVHNNEAVWLGMEFLERSDSIRLLIGDRQEWYGSTFKGAEARGPEMVSALPGPRGTIRFGPSPSQCARLEIDPLRREVGRARVDFVDPETFEKLTARAPPRPAREEDAYGDWRLP